MFSLWFCAHRKQRVIRRWKLFALWGLSEPARRCRGSAQHVQETKPATQREQASNTNIQAKERRSSVCDGQARCGVCSKGKQGRAETKLPQSLFRLSLYKGEDRWESHTLRAVKKTSHRSHVHQCVFLVAGLVQSTRHILLLASTPIHVYL